LPRILWRPHDLLTLSVLPSLRPLVQAVIRAFTELAPLPPRDPFQPLWPPDGVQHLIYTIHPLAPYVWANFVWSGEQRTWPIKQQPKEYRLCYNIATSDIKFRLGSE